MHNLHSCSPQLKASIDAHAATLTGWGVPPVAIERAAEAAVIVASLTEDAVLAGALLAQASFAADVEEAREIELHFGPTVTPLARELAHFGDIRLTPGAVASHHLEPTQAEALRKMLLSVVSDPRLVLARLARQLVDLNAARDGHAATRERLALETREVFAPLANRLGLWQLKWELEDLAFRYLQPDDYRRIATALAEKRADRERYVSEFCAELTGLLSAAGLAAEVYGRPKHIYSIHRKMERKQLSFAQVFDLRAVRIIAATVADCYAALGLVHGRYSYVPGEFDDYIATPKDNLYRSIHTAVLGPEGKAVEVQIRTREMHDQAELGLAAHWRYKESRAHDVSYDRKIEWVRQLLATDHRQDAEGQRDFLDTVRAELFEDRVYTLTPKGEVVDLPPGATPLDFAYHVHTDLGHRCRGARVNGRIVPLTRALANGEVVEILTHKLPQPSRDWLSETAGFLVSPRSRAKVRAWFRKLDEEAARLAPQATAVTPAAAAPAPRRKALARKTARSPVLLGGVEDLPISMARCCAPVKPEPIAGYATVGRGVTIHRSDCPGLKRMLTGRPDRLISATWADAAVSQPVSLNIVAIDRQGLVRDIGDLLASEKISIEMMHTTTDRTRSTATIDVRVAIDDAQHLTRLLQRIRRVGSVLSVRRTG